ncbi:OPT super [Coemansia sp. RSA 1813]|nr:OPT super [Coemansia sp. RSA 1813]
MGSQNARLMKEFRMLQKELPQGIICTPRHERLDSYEASIEGPPSTPYENGRFLIDVSLSSRYPIEPPSLKFKSKIYHPNIDDHGNICLDVLKSGKKGSWNPSWTLGRVLVAMTVLLSTPNPYDPLMPEIADQLLNDHAGFERTAREWTSKYAMGFSDDPAEYMVTSQELAPQTPERPAQSAESNEHTSQDVNAKSNSPASQAAVAVKCVAPADPASPTAPTRKKLGLSRKSSSSSPDPVNSLPPLPGKLPAAGIRRLGLSRNRNAQRQQKQQQSSLPRQSVDGSSQAESIELTSDDSGSSVLPKSRQLDLSLSPKARKTRDDSDSQSRKRQKKGTNSLSRILASNHKKPKPKAAQLSSQDNGKKLESSQESVASPSLAQKVVTRIAKSTLPKTGVQRDVLYSKYTPGSAASEESEEILFIHDPACSSADEINSSMDYECLLSPGKNAGSRNTAGSYDDSEGLPTVKESPLPSSSPLLHDADRNGTEGDAAVVASDQACSSHDAKDKATDIAGKVVPKATTAPSARRKEKGKAVDFSRQATSNCNDGDGGGCDKEQKVLYESHFGPLALGLPPIRVNESYSDQPEQQQQQQQQKPQNRRHKVDTSQPQFTWRAIVVGLLFGTILCFSNLWFGLQSGWISMMSLQSSLVGFAVFKAFEHVLDIPFGPAENVVLQSTAVATATMPLAGGFVGILPALKMLDDKEAGGSRTVLNYGQLCAWGLALTFFGVFFAIPLRKQTIIREKLRFPSGTATAQMISVLHKRPDPTIESEYQESTVAESDSALVSDAEEDITVERQSVPENEVVFVDDVKWATKLFTLFSAFILSGIYALLAHFFPIISALPVFGVYLSKEWAWNLMPSLSYAGQGIIMGLPTCVWMLVGSLVGWGILSPLAKNEGWAPGPVSDWKDGSRGWILWISLAVMISESLISLGLVCAKEIYILYSRFQSRMTHSRSRFHEEQQQQQQQHYQDEVPTQTNNAHMRSGLLDSSPNPTKQTKSNGPALKDEDTDEVDPRFLVPGWITWGGLGASTVLCMGIVKALFDVPMYDTLIAVALALPLAVLGVRALGETDLNPVSGIGKVSQVVFAGVMPGNLVGNLVAGGIAEAGAQQAGDLMQDLKTGHLLNASPRAQFSGQIIGSMFSVFVTAGAYLLYTRVYPIPGPQFPVPTAQVWLDMARLVNGHPLPPHVWPFIIAFAALFFVLPIGALVLGMHGSKIVYVGRWSFQTATLQRWWPSGIAFAIGIYNTPNFTLMRAIGAIVTTAVTEIIVSRDNSNKSQTSQAAVAISNSAAMQANQEAMLRRKIGMMAIILASGFVLGEGTFSFFILLSQAFSS